MRTDTQKIKNYLYVNTGPLDLIVRGGKKVFILNEVGASRESAEE